METKLLSKSCPDQPRSDEMRPKCCEKSQSQRTFRFFSAWLFVLSSFATPHRFLVMEVCANPLSADCTLSADQSVRACESLRAAGGPDYVNRDVLFREAADPFVAPVNVDSLQFKIGQMIMIGFRGTRLEEGNETLRQISKLHLGGVVLFDVDVATKTDKRNISSPAQVRELTRTLQKAASMPLFIAVDQEGGRVSRLKSKYGFPSSVSQQYLGGLDNPDSTRAHALQTASTLYQSGINLNFAPVVDVNVNPSNPVIGKLERSFSSDPEVVTRNAVIVTEAFHERGILSSIKHFPGHGSSTADSHEGFVDVTGTWTVRELQPFAELIRRHSCDMVMTAHIFNAKLDGTFPATLSRRTLFHMLRDSLGYSGVIVTDDMQMKAIRSLYPLDTAVYRAIDAGADILLFGNNTGEYDPDIAETAVAAVVRLIAAGRISVDRIEESWRRIRALKARL